eukprot:TRINITY_DN31565_c0_g1_i1.p1 TRINITY_DN31565_c0_g1~~TRINITY_DN31565_c0_g1_i1.p1  ORF type:complete len:431 (+),score=63.41 TRINITY_DN31565_c0_g1_i1:121-1413(+)
MPRAIDKMIGDGEAGKHVDAYQEYSNLVGRLDGGHMLPDAEYRALRRRAADGSRRLYVYYRNRNTGLDCKAIGPQSMCFCGHRYNEHDWGAFETRRVGCKMPGCKCTCFSYIPVRGSQDQLCSTCRKSFREHRADNHGCPTGAGAFTSSYSCSCMSSYMDHGTVFESRGERERAGRPVDAGWMEKAAAEGLPVCHLGGIIGFTSLADGIDRAYAGLEGNFGGDALAAGLGGHGGADRFVSRMALEDEVNTASLVHGRQAGARVLAKAQAKRGSSSNSSRGQLLGAGAPPMGLASGSAAASSSRGELVVAAGAKRRGVSEPPSSGAASGNASRANIHTLGGPVLGAGQAIVKSSPGPQRALAKAGGAALQVAGRRPSSRGEAGRAAVPPPLPRASAGGSSAAAQRGGRVGGTRASDADAMRQARLAKFGDG